MIGAFAYLTYYSARNGLVARVRRLRNPRYAVALLLGLAYFWFVFFTRSVRQGREIPSPVTGQALGILLPGALLLYVAFLWIVGADASALAFTNAEVSMLFTAPVSRRGLIVYKLMRSQATVLTSSIVWVLLFGRGPDPLTRALGYWVLFSTLSLHRLGVALIRASSKAHGATALRRNWLAGLAFGVVAVVVVSTFFGIRDQLIQAAHIGDVVPVLTTAFDAAPLKLVMYPFRVAVTPALTAGGLEWLRAMGPAVALLSLHFVWVLRSDAAFEEAAAEASAKRARRLEAMRFRRDTGAVSAKSVRWSLPLAATGGPSVALIWKNTLWVMRSGHLGGLMALPLAAWLAAVVYAGRSHEAAMILAVICGAVAAVMLVFGPATMRNDLRGELRRLPMIKVLPLSGQQIILAEVASSAIPIMLVQYLLVLAGLVALSVASPPVVSRAMALAIVVSIPLTLLGVNIANFMIHNAFALLLPGWVRLGESGGGIEAMGQAMLTSIVTLVMLALLLIGPAIGVAGVYFALRSAVVPMIVVGGTLAGAALCLEAYLLAELLGGTLERLEL